MSTMSDKGVRLLAVGDIALSDRYADLLGQWGADYPFEKVHPLLSSADVLIGNLEGPFTDREHVYPIKCSLRSSPKYVKGLKNAGFSVVSLANNHVLDSGPEGLKETRRELDRFGIKLFLESRQRRLVPCCRR